jgi:uncharacterized protein (TIGR02145 family)
MKKFLVLLLGIALVYSCSTSTDENGNSTTTVVPVGPSNLTGSVASSTQINLSWTDNSTNETGYKIERKTGTEIYAIIGTTATNVTTFNDTGLTPNTTYTYRVYSYNTVGNSLTYSNAITLTTSNSTAINVSGPNVTDIDGNTYQSVTNCGLIFTKQNLNVSKYTDGTPIPQVTDQTQWGNLTTGAWCYYANNTANGKTYGKLYNWFAVAGIYNSASATNPALRKKLAPTGWHIPTDTEWTQLVDCLGGSTVAGGKMKSTGTIQAGNGLWQSPNAMATNESGFTGLPGGERYVTYYSGIGNGGIWWSSSEVNFAPSSPWAFFLDYGYGNIYGDNYSREFGYSVRCIKD